MAWRNSRSAAVNGFLSRASSCFSETVVRFLAASMRTPLTGSSSSVPTSAMRRCGASGGRLCRAVWRMSDVSSASARENAERTSFPS